MVAHHCFFLPDYLINWPEPNYIFPKHAFQRAVYNSWDIQLNVHNFSTEPQFLKKKKEEKKKSFHFKLFSPMNTWDVPANVR